MGMYKYDNKSYDINEETVKYREFEEPRLVESGTGASIGGSVPFGYSSVALYSLKILSGLSGEIEDYNYNSKIYMIIKEIYRDSEGKEHFLHKLINVGGYVKERNKQLEMKHLTHLLGGQLVGITGVLYNFSDYDITIQDLCLYKCVEYSNAYISDDVEKIDKITDIIVDPTDIDDGTSEEVYKTNIGSIIKIGDKENWNVTSEWVINLKESNGSAYIDKDWVAFDDKGNYIGKSSDDRINLVDYTEYLIFYFDTSVYSPVGKSPDRVMYMNNLGRKYKGNANTYHYKFDDSINVQYDGFGLWSHDGGGNNYKYDNGTGVLTFQLEVVDNEGIAEKTYYKYFSTQPFYYTYALNTQVSYPILIDNHLCWFMDALSIGNTQDGEDIVTTSVKDAETILESTYNSYSDAFGFLKQEYFDDVFGGAVRQLTIKDVALETKYADGNI